MIKYMICFIAKCILGSFAIATYMMCKDVDSAEATIGLSVLTFAGIIGCILITAYQFA